MTPRRAVLTGVLLAALAAVPVRGWAASAVFNGDPVDPVTSVPYEILPGLALVQAGPDGFLGTADDIVNPAIVGDIDLVVRSGSPAAGATIPPPSARETQPIGIAGSTAAGGKEVPFTVFLSDGATGASAPAGHLLAANDMDGHPAIVAAFADLDGDGFIGPTDQDRAGSSDNSLEVRELDPVGRAVALFSGGVARGGIAIRTGLPASRRSLQVALCAMALTGPFDPAFFQGNIPTGPAISTAMPFLPQRDLTRLVRDRPAPVGPTTTLQNVVQFAAIPDGSKSTPLTLPLDGSSVTIDVARVRAQNAVRVELRPQQRGARIQPPAGEVVLGTLIPENRARLRLIPVDRWGNPADPVGNLALTLAATPPLQIVRPPGAATGLTVRSAAGTPVTLQMPAGAPDGTAGTITVELDGVVVDALPYRVDARFDHMRPDVRVPSLRAPTIQAAINAVFDRNHDGKLVIDVKPGLYREDLVVNRSVVLRGREPETTIVQGSGSGSVISVSAANATVEGLTAVGGTSGFALSGASTRLLDVTAWHNLGAGIAITGSDAEMWQSTSAANGGDGLQVNGGTGSLCFDSEILDNGGTGVSVAGASGAQVADNRVGDNAVGGISLISVTDALVDGNRMANNLGSGVQMLSSQGNQITNNLSAKSDEDGLTMESTTSNVVSGNSFTSNHGYGMSVRKSNSDDFAAAPGVQAPLGDNSSSDNRKGDLRTN